MSPNGAELELTQSLVFSAYPIAEGNTISVYM